MTASSRDPVCLVYDQLDAALDHATDEATRFHIRTALQAVEGLSEADRGQRRRGE